MSQFKGKNDRIDSSGFSTSIKPLGNGKYGARVYRNGKLHSWDNTLNSRYEAALALKDLLRWVDKLGFDSPMADASRERNYCNRKKVKL